MEPPEQERTTPQPSEPARQPENADELQSEGGSGPDDTPQAPDYGTDEIRQSQVVFNYVRNVTADSATFGIAGRETRRATGRVEPEEVSAALEWYVPPAALAEANGILGRTHLVVLSGTEGIGKRATALRLLSDLCAGTGRPMITSLSPAISLMQLATTVKFRAGKGYLVRDHVGDGAELSVRTHDAEVLASAVRQAGAYLVITTMSSALGSRHLPGLAVSMDAPDPLAVLDRCLESVRVDDEVRDRARAHAARMRCPRDVVDLARRLASRPDEAFDALQTAARDQVISWADGRVTRQDVLSVATVALFGVQPEPTFEALLATLSEHAEPAQEERDAAPYLTPDQDFMPKRQRDHELLTVITETAAKSAGRQAGRTVRFRSAEHREIYETLGFGSMMMVPLVARGVTRGAMGFFSARRGRYGADELALAHDLALGPARQVDVACEHPALVVSSARTIATAARSPAALLRIAAVPRFVIPRVVSIEHSSPLVVDTTTREGPTAVSGGWWQSSSDLRMHADGAGS